jgi:flagellar hook-length control protein FliK
LAAPRERSDKVDAPAAKAEVDVARVQAATDKQISPGSGPARAGDGAQAPGAEQAERVQFIQRVARAFEAAADRGGTLRLRLHPPELGSLRLELSLRRGAMTARLETETEAARTMLLDNLPALRQRLAEHQIRVERFDVQWTGPSAGDLPGQADRHARWQASGTRHAAPAGTRADEPPANPAPVRSPARPGQGAGFDVIV